MMTTALSSRSPLRCGDPAPDAALTDTEGCPMRLSDFWGRGPIVLVLLRHFGCTFCREQVALLRRDYAKFRAAGAEIVCVAQGDAQTGKAFSIFFDLPFPLLLCGDDLAIYQSYGLGRGTPGQLFGWRSWWHGFGATLRGHLVGRLVGDGFQMPGTFVVDTSGIIRDAHINADAADHPDHAVLHRVIQELTRTYLINVGAR